MRRNCYQPSTLAVNTAMKLMIIDATQRTAIGGVRWIASCSPCSSPALHAGSDTMPERAFPALPIPRRCDEDRGNQIRRDDRNRGDPESVQFQLIGFGGKVDAIEPNFEREASKDDNQKRMHGARARHPFWSGTRSQFVDVVPLSHGSLLTHLTKGRAPSVHPE